MSAPKAGGPGARVRAGGGFNQFADELGGEHLQSSAMQQAMQQKAAAQKTADPRAGQTSQAKMQQQALAQQLQQQQERAGGQPQAPREVGTIPEEFKRMGQDAFQELKSFFSLNTWLGVKPETDDPEEVAKRKKLHERWQNLTEEQQAVAKRQYQEELERKRAEEEEAQQKKQLEEQKKERGLPMPASPQKGPIGPGTAGKSKKQDAVQRLQQSRQQLSGPSSLN